VPAAQYFMDGFQQARKVVQEMAEQLCPVCGCTIVGEGSEKKGIKYYCEACATDSGACQCDCFHPVDSSET